MTQILSAPDGIPRVVVPTTTTRLARRMLAASRVIADGLPRGFHGSPALDILLALHVAEEDAHYPAADTIVTAGSVSPAVTGRWINILVEAGLIDRRGDLLALSTDGHAMVCGRLETVFAVQRSLD